MNACLITDHTYDYSELKSPNKKIILPLLNMLKGSLKNSRFIFSSLNNYDLIMIDLSIDEPKILNTVRTGLNKDHGTVFILFVDEFKELSGFEIFHSVIIITTNDNTLNALKKMFPQNKIYGFNNTDNKKIINEKALKILNDNGIAGRKEVLNDFDLVFGDENIHYDIDEFVVLCLVKNGEHYIDQFIKHYKNLGARHIYFIDNYSSDDTVLKIKKYSNVSIYSTDLLFKDYECEIRNKIISLVSKDRWCLAVDIDEFFDYPYSDRISMKQFIRYLNKYKYTGVVANMLDMFSKKPFIHEKNKQDDDFVKTCCYYDISNIVKHDYGLYEENKKNQFESKYIKIYKGGIRSKIFGNNSPFFLIKHPLMFIDENIIPFTTPHFCNMAKLADVTCILKHYKFINSFFDKVKKIISENNYPKYALTEYKMYNDYFKKNTSIGFYSENSMKFNNVIELVENDFINVSQKYTDYINSIKILKGKT